MELTQHCDNGRTYRLEVCITASLAPSSFTDPEMDDRALPVSCDELREAAEEVWMGRMSAWMLWDMRDERRRQLWI